MFARVYPVGDVVYVTDAEQDPEIRTVVGDLLAHREMSATVFAMDYQTLQQV